MKTPVHKWDYSNGKSVDYFHLSLRASGLLSDAQMESLEADCPARTIDVQKAWLVRKGWLTGYQVDQLLDNRRPQLTIGPYVILDELGEGSFGTVYKAVQTVMNRIVALKVIEERHVSSETARELFLREVIGLTNLSHPNISFAYDANRCDEFLYLAMEFIDGPTLKDYVGEYGPLPVPLACEIMLQVAHALMYTHEKGVVHRDIKPPNLLLPGFRNKPDQIERSQVLVKIIDFGLARLYFNFGEGIATLQHGGDLLGTPEFMSPEQVRNYHQVDIRSDLYSVGCSFYFALTGRVPTTGHTVLETIVQQLEREPDPIVTHCPGLDPELAAIVHRLMAKDPNYRFQTPAEFAAVLEHVAARYRCLPVAIAEQPDTNVDSAVELTNHKDFRDSSHDTPTKLSTADSPPHSAAADSVFDLWHRWQTIVADLIQSPQSAGTEEEYKLAHTGLMEALRAQLAVASPHKAHAFAKLEAFVEPWLTLRSITMLDAQVKSSLLQSCRALNDELTPPSQAARGSWPIRLWSAIAIAVAVSLGIFLVKLSSRF